MGVDGATLAATGHNANHRCRSHGGGHSRPDSIGRVDEVRGSRAARDAAAWLAAHPAAAQGPVVTTDQV